jgi:dUTP pyrophosphatase
MIFAANNPQQNLNVAIKKLDHGEDLPLPSYSTPQSAGLDLLAAIDTPITINPGERKLIPAGIAIALPDGYEAQVRPRSGLAIKNGITVLNAPGTIDSDYRGEIMGIMINLGQEPFVFTRGMRFAQLVISHHSSATWVKVDDLEESTRGEGRFGSTGL